MTYELLLLKAHPTNMCSDIRMTVSDSTYEALKEKNDFNEPVSFAVYKMDGRAYWVQLKKYNVSPSMKASEAPNSDRCCLVYETVKSFYAPVEESQKVLNGAFCVRLKTFDGCEKDHVINNWQYEITTTRVYVNPYAAPINDCGEKIEQKIVDRKYRWSREYSRNLPLFNEVI